MCEAELDKDPFNMKYSFRKAELEINKGDEGNLDEALRLLNAIEQRDPNFNVADILMLKAKRHATETLKENDKAI